jgi:hypothetical protein
MIDPPHKPTNRRRLADAQKSDEEEIRIYAATAQRWCSPPSRGQGTNLAFEGRTNCGRPTRRRVLREAEMRSVLMVQVDNLIPIVLNRERSVIRGIRGMGVLSGFMERL